MGLSLRKYCINCSLSYNYGSNINKETESGVGKIENNKERRKKYVKEISQI